MVICVSPADSITIQPHMSIVVEFTDILENLQVYQRRNAAPENISYRVSLSGRIATIRSPFSYLEKSEGFTKIVEALELQLFVLRKSGSAEFSPPKVLC